MFLLKGGHGHGGKAGQLVEFGLNDGGTILVEVREATLVGGPVTSDRFGEVVVAAATTRPEKLGQPFTRWSLRKLADYLACRPGRAT